VDALGMSLMILYDVMFMSGIAIWAGYLRVYGLLFFCLVGSQQQPTNTKMVNGESKILRPNSFVIISF
jgi:hypothetical protein